jgi:hypothetical protein
MYVCRWLDWSRLWDRWALIQIGVISKKQNVEYFRSVSIVWDSWSCLQIEVSCQLIVLWDKLTVSGTIFGATWNVTQPRSGCTCFADVGACSRSTPCLYGGTCTDDSDGSSYTCTCQSGYSGKNCQLSECVSDASLVVKLTVAYFTSRPKNSIVNNCRKVKRGTAVPG